ncbi:MAG: hypothetical protein HC806_09730 [Anaerolineae bacterium]|nr:hypothetical protein [Anaerolineae bacterium]
MSQNQTIGVRYDYSPYGEVETVDQVDGGGHSDFRYTGHFYHERSGLHLTLYRAYDPGLGVSVR